MEFVYIGKGIYSISDAAMLTGINNQSIRSWIKGKQNSPNIVNTDFALIDQIYNISFLDLIEILMIGRLRAENLSLQRIRKFHELACSEFNHDHPFATNRFWTDGENLFYSFLSQFVDLRKKQIVWRKIVEPFLRIVDYKDGVSVKWWVMDRIEPIVVDPLRSFGQPIIDENSVPTIALARAVKAEGSTKKVAKWYDIDEYYVDRAHIFELEYTKRIAA